MRPRRGTVGAVLAVVIAVGCSGESGEASPSPTPSPTESSPTATPSPSSPEAAKPTPPANADKRTDRSAIDFALYFVDVLNYTARSGNTDELQRISTDNCESCKNIIEVTNDVYANGGYIQGKGWSVDSYSTFSPGAGERRIVSLAITTSAQTYRTNPSEPEETIEAGKGRLSVYVKPRNDTWVITRMDRTQ